jgi:hypothetical protein
MNDAAELVAIDVYKQAEKSGQPITMAMVKRAGSSNEQLLSHRPGCGCGCRGRRLTHLYSEPAARSAVDPQHRPGDRVARRVARPPKPTTPSVWRIPAGSGSPPTSCGGYWAANRGLLSFVAKDAGHSDHQPPEPDEGTRFAPLLRSPSVSLIDGSAQSVSKSRIPRACLVCYLVALA